MGGTLILSDLHVGNIARFAGTMQGGINERCRRTLAAVGRALDAAVARKCSNVVVAGDIHDTDRPSPPVVAALMSLFASYDDIHFWLLVGNHDQHSEETGDNALAPYKHLPNVSVVEEPTLLLLGEGTKLLAVPYNPAQAGDVIGYLDSVTPNGESDDLTDYRVVGHFGIAHAETPMYLAQTQNCARFDDLIAYCQRHSMLGAYCGDWHRPWHGKRLGVELYQVGALAPVNFADGEHGGGRCLYIDPEGWVESIAVPGPRFVAVASHEDLTRIVKRDEDMTHGYVCVTTPGDAGQALLGTIRGIWPHATCVLEPRGADVGDSVIDAGTLSASWSPEAVESQVLGWVEAAVPDALKPDVAEAMVSCLRKAG